MNARRLLLATACLAIVGCGSPNPVGPSPSGATASGSAAIRLGLAPANLGCDAIGVPYRRVTFRIDATASEPVSAVANTGTLLHTFWSAGFQGGSADEPVVRDPAGRVVATNREVLAIPDGAWPRLHGYFVCPGPDALYILLADPA